MNLLSRLKGAGELLLYHDYRAGHFQDLSGQGKHGTPTGVSLIKRALCFANTTGQYVNAGADNIGTGAGSFWAFCRPFSFGEADFGRIFGNNAFQMYQMTSECISVRFSSIKTTANNAFPIGQSNFIICTWDAAGEADLWINGVQWLTSQALGAPSAGTNLIIGNRTALDRQFHGQMYAIGAVNRELTPAEIAELETEVRAGIPDTREVIREIDSSYDIRASHLGPGARVTTANVTTGQLPGTPFWVGSGSFSVDVDTVNGKLAKVLTCRANGVCFLNWRDLSINPSEAAYGTWEWWVNKANANLTNISFISELPGVFSFPGQDAYLLQVVPAETVYLYKITATAPSNLFNTAASASPFGTYAKYKVTRTVAGVFSCYIDGTLLTAVGGAPGTNPLTDNTHKINRYMVFEIDAGDKIALAHLDGTPLFSKYLGVV